jgi:hypothetical protein
MLRYLADGPRRQFSDLLVRVGFSYGAKLDEPDCRVKLSKCFAGVSTDECRLILRIRLSQLLELQEMPFTANLFLLDSDGFDAWLKVAGQSFCRPTTKGKAAI